MWLIGKSRIVKDALFLNERLNQRFHFVGIGHKQANTRTKERLVVTSCGLNVCNKLA